MSGPQYSEKDFLHDLATPLSTAIFLVQTLQEDLKSYPELIGHMESLKEMEKALERVTDLLRNRRSLIE